MNDQPARETFFGGCPHDCPDTCAMIYEVEDGKLVEVRGNKDHPMTRGTLCVKLKDYHDHHYNPDRVLYPLRRSGSKGSRQFTRISWDEAIAEITSRWKEIIAKYGSQAIMPYSYLGNEGLVQGLTAGDAFFNRLGSTVNEKTFCASGSSTAWLLTVGPTGGVDPESFVHSKYIVIWACNSISTNLHHWPFVLEARKRGAKVVVIDSYRSRTAKQADWHIMPKPGTDGAFAMGVIAALIENGLVDREWVDNHTVGFEELAERAKEFTPPYVERVTGVPAADVARFAHDFAKAQPSVIRMGVALERHAGGGQTIRAVCAIPALTGSWRHVGGGLLQMPLWEFPVDWARVSRPDFIRPGTRVVNNLQLGQALTGEMKLDPPIMGLYIYNTNPVSQAPETNKIVKGLSREDLFFVTAEHFVTDTAAYADIVLPATMAGEHDDMMFSWGHFYLRAVMVAGAQDRPPRGGRTPVARKPAGVRAWLHPWAYRRRRSLPASGSGKVSFDKPSEFAAALRNAMTEAQEMETLFAIWEQNVETVRALNRRLKQDQLPKSGIAPQLVNHLKQCAIALVKPQNRGNGSDRQKMPDHRQIMSAVPPSKGVHPKIDKSVLTFGEPKRIRCKEHLRFVASQPCLICGRSPSHAHHVRYAQSRGLSLKVSDEFTVPLCAIHHHSIHTTGKEREWWQERNIDPLKVAADLWQRSREQSAGALKAELSESLDLEAQRGSADDFSSDAADASGRGPGG